MFVFVILSDGFSLTDGYNFSARRFYSVIIIIIEKFDAKRT